jgi:macrolide transport system ATP-binding/permease protein
MLILEAYQVEKWQGDRLLFAIDQLQVAKGAKVGIVGVNGVGKTTLLRVLAGEEEVDEGNIRCYGTIGWIRQEEEGASDLSGGEQTRGRIIPALREQPSILFADEPTSHLDMETCQWLEKELSHFTGTLLLVSHDRMLLDAICTQIIEVEQGKIDLYSGNYSNYRQQKEQKRERAAFEYQQYAQEKKRLTEAAKEKKRKSQSMNKPPTRMSTSESRLYKMGISSKITKVNNQAKALESRIHQLERKEKPLELPTVQFDVKQFHPIQGKIAVRFEKVKRTIGNKTLFEDFTATTPTGKKVGIIGRNGAGKSTLLEMVRSGWEGITLAPASRIGYFQQKLRILDESQSILENVKQTSPYSELFLRTTLARLLFPREAVDKQVGVLSGGEKVKIGLAKVFLSDANLLLLDEPTNFLDIFAREGLENVLAAYPGTILFTSHDRQFMERLAEHVIVFEQGNVTYFSDRYDLFLSTNRHYDKEQEQKHRLLQVENELTQLLGRLSIPQKGDDPVLLEQRFQELVKEKRRLKEARVNKE